MNADSKTFQVELVISEILRWGVRASLLLLAGGSVLCFLGGRDYGTGGGTAADLHRLITTAEGFPRSLSWLGSGLIHGNGQALIVAGLLLLIATPIVRVLVSIIAFLTESDWAYAIITSIVFLLLLLSFVFGKAG